MKLEMSWAGWQRLVRKIKKGEPISYSHIEPCETKFFLLYQKCTDVSEIHDDDGGESNPEKLNKDDEKFLKNYVEKKKWVFKNKGKSCEFDNVDDISEDEKEIKKQEKYEAEFNSLQKKNMTQGELKKVKSEISRREIKKGEPISYSDIEPCESKFILLPIKNFSDHDENDEETELRKLRKLRKLNDVETMFLKNYVEKKRWYFRNKRKSREFDDLDYISEDEKGIKKQERYAEFNSPYDLREYALQFEPVAEENGDRMQVVEVNGDTGKSSKKCRRNGGLEECKTSKERRKAYGLGDIGTNNKKKNNGRTAA